MGILNFFRKENKYELPEIYSEFINVDDYNIIIETIKKYFENVNIDIIAINEGEIIINNGDEGERHFYLDNLTRVLAGNERNDWENIINEHFEKSLKDNSSALNFLYKDFEYAEQYLRILIKPDDVELFGEINDFIYRVDIPKTYTILVLEFENQFHYIQKENIIEWNKTESELLEIALKNTPSEEIEVNELNYEDKFKVFAFFSGDYSASLMLDIENRIEFALGTFGSLVAIPTKGSAFVHPIESDEVLDVIISISENVIQIYNEDPGNISSDYYWYYNGQFEIFPIAEDENGCYVRLPERLIELLKS